jgi:ABC-type multidrug transport system fused ATPase/permease subunit
MFLSNDVGQGSRMVASGELNVGLVLNVLFAVIIASFSLSQILPRLEAFSKATAAAQTIFQTIYREPSIDSLSDEGEKPDDLRGEIEFKNVSFIYPSRPEGIHSSGRIDIFSDSIEECLFVHSSG